MDISPIRELTVQYLANCERESLRLSALSVFRRESVSGLEAVVYEPVMCLILQGSKNTSIGDQFVELRPGDALLVSHDLPVVSRITRASVDKPYLALILSLDLGIVRSLYEKVADVWELMPGERSLSVGNADPAWLAPLARYLELKDHPLDAKVLGPSILREIHYRLLLSPMGGMLRNLLRADSHASRITRAIREMRKDSRSTIHIPYLARSAGMSESSFHHHFKVITGTTPLQFIKDLRLIEAKALLVDRNCSVAESAYAVGYESPTHFSRDYRRKFGSPPSKIPDTVTVENANQLAIAQS